MYTNNAIAVAIATFAGLASAKRGLVYNDANLANIFGSQCPSCDWGYNWDSSRNGLDPKYNFAPMLWKDGDNWTPKWDGNVEQALSEGSTHLLSFNEPDMPSQANMSPGDAAAAHIRLMNKYQGRAYIGSPAVTNSGDPNQGLGWLQSFMNACNDQGGCAIDFCNVHWYSDAQWRSTLYDHLSRAHDICGGKNIWLTEFAANDADHGIISDFIGDVVPQLDGIGYVERYSYFMVADTKLMNGNSLSDYGQVYASV